MRAFLIFWLIADLKISPSSLALLSNIYLRWNFCLLFSIDSSCKYCVDEQTGTLTIKAVRQRFLGKYTCTATGVNGDTASGSAQLRFACKLWLRGKSEFKFELKLKCISNNLNYYRIKCILWAQIWYWKLYSLILLVWDLNNLIIF